MKRPDLERKRMQRLVKGQTIHIRWEGDANKVKKAKVINNFKNAQIVDFEIHRSLIDILFFGRNYHSKDYAWEGFDITLKEDLI